MLKKSFLITGMLFLAIGAHVFYSPLARRSLAPTVLAEDEEEDEEDEEEEEREDNQVETEYQTIYTKLPDTVVETTKEVPLRDSDMDGMYDDADPHPTINEFLIVKDENLNGIDDKYEQQ